MTARLPWNHIDIGLEPDFLAKEYRKALKDRLSPPCGKPYKKLLHPSSVAAAEAGAKDKLVCYDCGVACDLDAMKAERLFYLRRMNAWGGAAPPPVAPSEQTSAESQAIAVAAAASRGRFRTRRGRRRARCRGSRTATASATPSSGASSISGTSIWCATCRASSGAPGSRSITRSDSTPSPSCRSARRSGSASRRWASSST